MLLLVFTAFSQALFPNLPQNHLTDFDATCVFLRARFCA